MEWEAKEVTNYTYILSCGDGSLYTGWTNDIKKRLAAHRNGTGAKYTKGRGPLTLVYLERFETKAQAMQREAQLKRLPRKKKEVLIGQGDWQEQLEGWGLAELEIHLQ